MFTVKNILFYGGLAIYTNVMLFFGMEMVFNPRMNEQNVKVYIPALLPFAVIEAPLQILIFEVSAVLSIIIGGVVSVATFVIGIATVVFIFIPKFIIQVIYNILSAWYVKYPIILVIALFLLYELDMKFHVIRKLKAFVRNHKLTKSQINAINRTEFTVIKEVKPKKKCICD